MSIKHDNVVPSNWPGVQESTGIPSAIVSSVDPATRGTVRYLNSRGQGQQALLVNNTLPPQALPPVAKYQVPGNANSTDYSCGNEAREKILNEPIPAPPVIVEVLGFYANDDSMPLGYDPTLPASQLIVNTDFWVNLRIQPSVGLDGFDPTIIFLNNNIDGTAYPSPAGYPGTFAGNGASDFGGAVYKVPSFYIGQVGLATMTFTAGQPTVNTTFGTATGAIPIVSVPTVVVATVEQQGWFPGIPAPLPEDPTPPAATVPETADANVDSVYVGQALQLAIVGPPSATYSYTLPWASGTSTTDSNGRGIIPGIAMQAGTWPFTVIFSGIAPVSKTFLVMDSYTAPDGFNGSDADGNAASADGDGDGGDGDGGDGGGGDGGGGGGGGGAM